MSKKKKKKKKKEKKYIRSGLTCGLRMSSSDEESLAASSLNSLLNIQMVPSILAPKKTPIKHPIFKGF